MSTWDCSCFQSLSAFLIAQRDLIHQGKHGMRICYGSGRRHGGSELGQTIHQLCLRHLLRRAHKPLHPQRRLTCNRPGSSVEDRGSGEAPGSEAGAAMVVSDSCGDSSPTHCESSAGRPWHSF
ncbi:hypothetical protein KC19_11G127600 [Ceratodon purpureus]|uniref:Uncharacterized protein n=1 Tax=Ceratodon purpureus TaxID=3225 RepID=A0A8T0GGX3_CERPU|nr:hypothetical protein KC19_11G127600 [Ceratodon purpureus]